MALSPSRNQPDDHSFLRTGAPDPTGPIADTQAGQTRICPPPLLDPELITPLGTWDHFGVWAIRIDPPATANVALHEALSACLARIAETHGARWFQWDSALYGCSLSGMDAQTAVTLARQFQDTWSQQRVESISIGVSQFPLLDYDRSACLGNACKALDHAAFFGPGSVVVFDAVSLNISGDHYYQDGHLDEAIAEYRAALRLDPDNVNVHNSLGGCLAQKENRAAARAAFEAAYRIDERDPLAVYNLGVLHLLDGESGPALEKFRQALELDPATFDPSFQVGKLLTEQQGYEEARHHLGNAIHLRPDCASAHSLLGQCLAALGHTQEAIMACKKAVKLNPNDAAAFSQLGALYDAKGENPEICVTFCRQSVALSPDNGLFHMRLAALYHKHAQLDQALAAYQAAAELGSDASRQIADIQEQLAAIDTRQRYA